MNRLIKVAINLDEISDDLRSSVNFLVSRGVRFAEIRTINGRNIVDYSLKEAKRVSKYLSKNGLKVSAIASPLFKWHFHPKKSDIGNFDSYFFNPILNQAQKKKYILKTFDIAEIFNTKYIRTFSNLKQEGTDEDSLLRDKIFDFLLKQAEKRRVFMLLENEPACQVARQKDYLRVFDAYKSKYLRAWVDIANFYQVNETFDQNFLKAIIPYLEYLHIKDMSSLTIHDYVPLGKGFINYKRIFSDISELLDRQIFASIETHVKHDREKATLASLQELRGILLKKRVGYALVGAGRISAKHALALKLNANSEIRGVYDIDPSRSKVFAESNDAKVYKSFEELLSDQTVDVVNICTPHNTHINIAKKAIRANKIVLSEKPFAIKLQKLTSYLHNERAKRNTYVVFQNLYNKPVEKFLDSFAQGRLGKLQFFAINVRWWRDKGYFNDWHGKKKLAGGPLYNQVIHNIQLISKLTDLSLKKVKSIKKIYRNNSQLEDVGIYSVELKNGVIGYIELCLITKDRNLESTVFAIFTKGAVKIGGLSLSKQEYYYAGYNKQSFLKEGCLSADFYGNGHVRLIAALSDKILGNPNPDVGRLVRVDRILGVIRFIEKIYDGKN